MELGFPPSSAFPKLSLMDQAPRNAPQPWHAALERGRTDIAAGRVSELEPFLQALEAEDKVDAASNDALGINNPRDR